MLLLLPTSYLLFFVHDSLGLHHTVESESDSLLIAGVKARDMIQKPMLTPSNMDLAPAMLQSVQCMAIDSRKKFFDRIQTRSTLHKTWQKSARSVHAALTATTELAVLLRSYIVSISCILYVLAQSTSSLNQ